MVKNFDPNSERDLVFVPVGVNYDRVLEDRTLMLSQNNHAAARGVLYAVVTAFKFLLKNGWWMIAGRWYRFGYACVNFGAPLSMRQYVGERQINFRAMDEAQRHVEVEQLGRRVMDEIGRVVPVTPVALVASIFTQNPGKAFSELELKFSAYSLMTRLEGQGAHLYVPRQNHDYAITVGLRMLVLRRPTVMA